ncbi:hypothetical protein AMJ87_02300 [candidate division WOR_3 bacterium SM23_60]|uniref:Methyltransferase type 11 domain-containing protein n=1 Tax=candidate division WOR_3 bacterium SM23_60 TaxID=1703780 RepID=A0A0S8GJP0_UNCW3|nr:MAG: hypothetical protein AMJ87_02300 [candidate division WOR_3 bacterium SM23_60]
MIANSIFDIYTERYDEWFCEHTHAFLSELRALQREFINGGRGIEIGIGTGRFAQALSIRFGVDISYPMVRIAKNRGCEVAVADAENLPLAQNTFDYALLMVTICFVRNPQKVIREARRIITRNGKLIVGIIDKKSFLGSLYQKRKSPFYGVAHFYSAVEVIDMLRRNRFRNIEVSQTLFQAPEELHTLDEIRAGHGQGGFVVITGVK